MAINVPKQFNPNAYKLQGATRVELRLVVGLDMVPGAWHDIQDFIDWAFNNPYVLSAAAAERTLPHCSKCDAPIMVCRCD